jgi:hypothetical protein
LQLDTIVFSFSCYLRIHMYVCDLMKY